ncbi:unnamed protein product [Lota lota]
MAKTCQAALLAEEELHPRGPLATPHAQWLWSLSEQEAIVYGLPNSSAECAPPLFFWTGLASGWNAGKTHFLNPHIS